MAIDRSPLRTLLHLIRFPVALSIRDSWKVASVVSFPRQEGSWLSHL